MPPNSPGKLVGGGRGERSGGGWRGWRRGGGEARLRVKGVHWRQEGGSLVARIAEGGEFALGDGIARRKRQVLEVDEVEIAAT